jgi:hypothetical protein
VGGAPTPYQQQVPAWQHQQELNDMADWQSDQRARNERLAAGSKFAAGNIGGDQRHDTYGGPTYRRENDQITEVQK